MFHNQQSSWVPSNPYPRPHIQQPQIAHKVWILDCRSCRTFLTNRGMKAVLLLRPNVSLFSTDALPINCSAYTSSPKVLRGSSPACRGSSSGIPPRTCECLTQSLCCHGCGNTVGYMIVIPCNRCTSSITATNRATNGHRFVFHSSEIIGTERCYIPDEPGIAHFDPPPACISAAFSPPFHPPPLAHSQYSEYYHSSYYGMLNSQHQYGPTPPQLSPHSPYLPSPPLEVAELSHSPSQNSSTPLSPLSPLSASTSLPELVPASDSFSFPGRSGVTRTEPRIPYSSHTPSQISIPSQSHALPLPPSDKDLTTPNSSEHTRQALSEGDTVYWHHLSRTGEIPGVMDDERARWPKWKVKSGKLSKAVFDR